MTKMKSRRFKDEKGRVWNVTKVGSNLNVEGEKEENETLYEIARSCAYRLGIAQTSLGIPLRYINEHRRIWNCIWRKGESLDS
jgi:hypothetical protein